MTSNIAKKLELLSPARDLECAISAINHGADAVYMGGPAFGARSGAHNSIGDIGRAADYAHRFGARLYVAFNTLLSDAELEPARAMIGEIYSAGADALIIQDMGILELDIPPIALHSSTQCDNRTPEKVRFLEDAGFSQAVLARELGLSEISEISASTSIRLEYFIHGALCVGFSGRCYLSMAMTGRSSNRGECAQPCRLPCEVLKPGGGTVLSRAHLMSLKDMNQTGNLKALISAGISSFKIEGRLKDVSFVKNVTAHYRQELDRIISGDPEYSRASSGHTRFFFRPRPEKSFNRGFTGYMVDGDLSAATSWKTPKFAGEPVGVAVESRGGFVRVKGNGKLNNGDGLAFFDRNGELRGLKINRAEGDRIFPALPFERPPPNAELFRNHDHAFERRLEGKSSERRIDVKMRLGADRSGIRLTITDEDEVEAECRIEMTLEPARDGEGALEKAKRQLGRLGDTIFSAGEISIDWPEPLFIQASALNDLRRRAIQKLEAARATSFAREARRPSVSPPPRYPERFLSHEGNVTNRAAREFFSRHGAETIEDGYDLARPEGPVALLTSKHCLGRHLKLCSGSRKSGTPQKMILSFGTRSYTLVFDCNACEMKIVG